MKRQLADGTKPELEAIPSNRKGKKNGWLLVSVGLISLAVLSIAKQPPNGTPPPPKFTPPKQQASPPKRQNKKSRVFLVGLFAAIVGGFGIFMQLSSALAQEVPGQSETPILVNAIAGVVVSVCAVVLFADEVNVKTNPRVMRAIGLGLAFYALAQAMVSLFILWFEH